MNADAHLSAEKPEQAVLGALLIDNEARDTINGLTVDAFETRQHRLIFGAILDEIEDSGRADTVTVHVRLQNAGKADDAGGLGYLNTLAENTPSAANIERYAELVEQAAKKRWQAGRIADAQEALAKGDIERARVLVEGLHQGRAAARKRLSGKWAANLTAHLIGRYLIKNLLPSDALAQVIGEPNCGKSAVMLDIACHIAAQMLYRGQRVAGGPVAYFSLEAPRSVENRIVAWCLHHGVDRATLPLVVISGSLNLRDAGSVAEAFALLHDEAKVHGQFVLVVIDTQSRALPGGDENSAQDMTALIAAADRLRVETGATIALIHHVGKDRTRGGRGHSSQLGAVDLTLEIADREVRIGKLRDGDKGQPLPFDLLPVHLGQDEDGDDVTAVIAVAPPSGAASSKTRVRRPLKGYTATAMKAFNDLVIEGLAKTSPGTSTMPAGVSYLLLEDWRERFMRYFGRDKDETPKDADRRRTAWYGSRKALVEYGLVVVDGEFAWRP